MIFLALGSSVLAAILQAQAQVHVPVYIVQLIFSTIPIWSAMFSVVLLKEDWFSSTGSVGAAIVIAAGLVAALNGEDDTPSSEELNEEMLLAA